MAHRRIVSHYDKVVTTYINTPFYANNEHINFLLSRIKPFASEKVVLDIGCGTCQYAELLNAKKIICVDPSKEMLFKIPRLKNQEKHMSDGISFLKNNISQFDVILLKECLHHFSDKDHSVLLKLCYERAKTVIITARPHDNQYPWFKKAQISFEKHSLKISNIINILKELQFTLIQEELIFPIKMTAKQWMKMISNRFWSNLSYISDQDLKSGIDDIKIRHGSVISFNDKIVVIIARSANYLK